MGCGSSTVKNNKVKDFETDVEKKERLRNISFYRSGLVHLEAVSTHKNLFSAIKRGDLEGVKKLVDDEDVDQALGMWSSTPLIVAIQYGYVEIAEFLLDRPHCNINHRNEKGATAILYACMEGMTAIVKRLIKMGVSLHTEPSDNIFNQLADRTMCCTPLSITVFNGRQQILALLLDNGCSANTMFNFPTIKSIAKKKPNTTASAGVDGTNKVDSEAFVCSMTPILLACAVGQAGIVRELLWRSCDCDVVDEEGSTIFHHLARNKNGNSAEIFNDLKKHDKLNDSMLHCYDSLGDTCLHIACENKQVELVSLLLDEGCRASCKNASSGITPLHIAIKRKNLTLVNSLLEYGADPLVTDKAMVSAWDMAQKLSTDSDIYITMEKAAQAWMSLRSVVTTEAPSSKRSSGKGSSPRPGEQFTFESVKKHLIVPHDYKDNEGEIALSTKGISKDSVASNKNSNSKKQKSKPMSIIVDAPMDSDKGIESAKISPFLKDDTAIGHSSLITGSAKAEMDHLFANGTEEPDFTLNDFIAKNDDGDFAVLTSDQSEIDDNSVAGNSKLTKLVTSDTKKRTKNSKDVVSPSSKGSSKKSAAISPLRKSIADRAAARQSKVSTKLSSNTHLDANTDEEHAKSSSFKSPIPPSGNPAGKPAAGFSRKGRKVVEKLYNVRNTGDEGHSNVDNSSDVVIITPVKASNSTTNSPSNKRSGNKQFATRSSYSNANNVTILQSESIRRKNNNNSPRKSANNSPRNSSKKTNSSSKKGVNSAMSNSIDLDSEKEDEKDFTTPKKAAGGKKSTELLTPSMVEPSVKSTTKKRRKIQQALATYVGTN